jgi:acyl-CoA reductase-like NAD-dependent aldehyde dehydrogenase
VFFPPVILTNVSPESVSYREELFGPVATVYKVSSEDEAVELANDTPFGLGSYVFTTDADQAERVADKIDAGMVSSTPSAPRASNCGSAASSVPVSDANWAGPAQEHMRICPPIKRQQSNPFLR